MTGDAMDIRCGIDIVEIDRIAKALLRHESFKKKIFTPEEIAYCDGRGKFSIQSYAARFCCKEAVSKALGTGIADGISFLDIEVVNEDCGKPSVNLYHEAKKRFGAIGGKSIDISLSHTKDYAVAQAVILIY